MKVAKTIRIKSKLFFWLGILSVCVAMYLIGNTTIFLSKATARADGEVTGFKETYVYTTRGYPRMKFLPIISYNDAQRESYQLEFPFHIFNQGDHVPIAYIPSHPEQARVITFTTFWFPIIGVVVLSCVLLYVSLQRVELA